MSPSFTLRFKSALVAGAAAGLFAPMLWPFVVWAVEGRIADWHSLLPGLLAVAASALIAGLAISLLLGLPVLLLLHRLSLEQPLIIIGAGALISTATLSNFMSWPVSRWPLYLFAVLLGGLCGFVAVAHMHANRAVAHDRPQATRRLS